MLEIYLTEYRKDGKLFGGEVKAHSWEEAKRLAGFLGETVVGKLLYEVPVDPEFIERMRNGIRRHFESS